MYGVGRGEVTDAGRLPGAGNFLELNYVPLRCGDAVEQCGFGSPLGRGGVGVSTAAARRRGRSRPHPNLHTSTLSSQYQPKQLSSRIFPFFDTGAPGFIRFGTASFTGRRGDRGNGNFPRRMPGFTRVGPNSPRYTPATLERTIEDDIMPSPEDHRDFRPRKQPDSFLGWIKLPRAIVNRDHHSEEETMARWMVVDSTLPQEDVD